MDALLVTVPFHSATPEVTKDVPEESAKTTKTTEETPAAESAKTNGTEAAADNIIGGGRGSG